MSKNTSTKDYLALKFFNEDKFNFIGYIFTITIISFYMLITKEYNPTIAYIDLFAFYFCSVGFIYHGYKFIISDQKYIDEYYSMKKDTFVHLYFNYTNYPQYILEKYYLVKTLILFLPAIFLI